MARDIDKYAAAGGKRLKNSNGRYDLYVSEINELRQRATKGMNGLFYAITDAYCMGVEAGARMAANKQKAKKV